MQEIPSILADAAVVLKTTMTLMSIVSLILVVSLWSESLRYVKSFRFLVGMVFNLTAVSFASATVMLWTIGDGAYAMTAAGGVILVGFSLMVFWSLEDKGDDSGTEKAKSSGVQVGLAPEMDP